MSNAAAGLPRCTLDLCLSGKRGLLRPSCDCADAPTAHVRVSVKGFLGRVVITCVSGRLFSVVLTASFFDTAE